jgi:hypothetical protein
VALADAGRVYDQCKCTFCLSSLSETKHAGGSPVSVLAGTHSQEIGLNSQDVIAVHNYCYSAN